MSLVLVHLLDHRIGYLCQTFCLALEVSHCHIECFVCQFILFLVAELFFCERNLHCERLEQVQLTFFVVCIVLDSGGTTVPNHINDIHSDTFTHQRMAAFGINNRTLLIHYIVILQQTFTDTEVVFFYLFLCTLDGVGDHLVLDHFTFLESQFIHHAGDTVGREEAHQVVLE